MTGRKTLSTVAAITAALAAGCADAQTITNLNALQGLAPLTVLCMSDAGKAALWGILRSPETSRPASQRS